MKELFRFMVKLYATTNEITTFEITPTHERHILLLMKFCATTNERALSFVIKLYTTTNEVSPTNIAFFFFSLQMKELFHFFINFYATTNELTPTNEFKAFFLLWLIV